MTEVTPRELDETLGRFGPAFMQWVKADLDDEGISFARLRLLHVLQEEGPQIMNELSQALEITARSVTSLVDGLEAAGLVERRPHPEDRRATYIALTDDGHEMLERLREARVARLAELLSVLDPDEQAELTQLLAKLVGALEDRLAAGVAP